MINITLHVLLIMCHVTQLLWTEEYRKEILAWRQQQDDRLKAPDGWLALIGHHWLTKDMTAIGKDDRSDIPLPEFVGAQCRATIIIDQGKIWLESDLSSGILVNGKAIAKAELKIDQTKPESDSQDAITVEDRLRLQLVRRNSKLAIRIRDSQSNAIQYFRGKRWFNVDPAFRVEARFKSYDPPRRIQIVNIRGDVVPSEIVGQLQFELQGKKLALDAIQESEDSLFVLFKDKTNGQTTYGPGRFLDVAKTKDEHLVLDFNKAYNPPCAFNPNTLCPLPPKQNHLDLEITAGEKAYDHGDAK